MTFNTLHCRLRIQTDKFKLLEEEEGVGGGVGGGAWFVYIYIQLIGPLNNKSLSPLWGPILVR